MATPHVFVTLGNIKELVCDAWLLPGNTRPHISKTWQDLSGLLDAIYELDSSDFQSGRSLTLAVTNWSGTVGTPILAPVDRGFDARDDDGPSGTNHLVAVVTDFVRVGSELAKAKRASLTLENRTEKVGIRPVPLLAMPLFGAERGGFGKVKGELVRLFLDTLRSASKEYGVDCVLVFQGDIKSYALAQAVRRENDDWFELSDDRRSEVERLSEHARIGKLVPFMGAGTSVSAGIPSWRDLLRELASRAGLDDERVDGLLDSQLDALDQAAYIQSIFPSRGSADFRQTIVELVHARAYGLLTALIASLRSSQAITMNYDDLYERAYLATGKSISVIPDRTIEPSENWLLKLHGSVNLPESIVLTRDDYLGYSTSREALSAIVKANLITHHILFIGFGFLDPHFQQIMHDVRRALPPADKEQYATGLMPQDDPVLHDLWKSELRVVSMGASKNDLDESMAAAREIEIFMDALAMRATDGHEYLLDTNFETGLTSADVNLRQAIDEFLKMSALGNAHDSASWSKFKGLFEQLGAENID